MSISNNKIFGNFVWKSVYLRKFIRELLFPYFSYFIFLSLWNLNLSMNFDAIKKSIKFLNLKKNEMKSSNNLMV